jgi:hypothetical protein
MRTKDATMPSRAHTNASGVGVGDGRIDDDRIKLDELDMGVDEMMAGMLELADKATTEGETAAEMLELAEDAAIEETEGAKEFDVVGQSRGEKKYPLPAWGVITSSDTLSESK